MLTEVRRVKAMVFPIVMYGCESWTIKKAECQRIDSFELWDWRRLLRVPWTARRSNQSILKEINTNIHQKAWCWFWTSNTLATWYKELTHLKRPWCWKRLRVRGKGGWQNIRWLNDIIYTMDMSFGKLWEIVKDGVVWCPIVHGVTNNWTQLSNWTMITTTYKKFVFE